MSTPALRTTVVGSYPIPAWLAAFPTQQAVADAIKVVFKTQELAGIDVVADGELYRFDVNHPDTNGMIEYFTRPMSGIRSGITRTDIDEFHKAPGMSFRPEPAGVVEGPVGEGTLNLSRDYRRSRENTRSPLKFTVTSPFMLCRTLLDRHYGDGPALADAIGTALAHQVADIDPDVLQVDEANIAGNPEAAQWAAHSINLVLDAATNAKEKGVHVCFGNYGGQTIQKGEWRKLLGFMNQLHCDHVILEFALRGYDELHHFRGILRPDIAIGVGVIDIKTNVVESPETVARRIDLAHAAVGPGRIKWVHPDCGFWMLHRSVVDRKMDALVKGRDLFLGSL